MADLADRLVQRLGDYETAARRIVSGSACLLDACLEHHPEVAPIVSLAAHRWSAGLRDMAESFDALATRADGLVSAARGSLWALDVALTTTAALDRLLARLDASHAACRRDGDDYPKAVIGGAAEALGGRDTHLGQAVATWAIRVWTQSEHPQ